MIKSMTGFGFGQAENENYSLNVEIRCVNSKSLDAHFRLPKIFSDKEMDIRNMLAQGLERGKVVFQIEMQSKLEAKSQTSINKALLKTYFTLLTDAATELEAPTTELFKMALQMPDVIQYNEGDEESAENWLLLQKATAQAISTCNDFRNTEGKSLEENFISYLRKIQDLLKKIDEHDPKRLLNIKTKIENKLIEIAKDEKFDKNRFEQEMIYYIEKLDIAEEKVRLGTHLNYFLEVLNSEENQGRKLNFISQEIGREINTIGSKANDANIQRYVVEMKEELEKIKEQALNIL